MPFSGSVVSPMVCAGGQYIHPTRKSIIDSRKGGRRGQLVNTHSLQHLQRRKQMTMCVHPRRLNLRPIQPMLLQRQILFRVPLIRSPQRRMSRRRHLRPLDDNTSWPLLFFRLLWRKVVVLPPDRWGGAVPVRARLADQWAVAGRGWASRPVVGEDGDGSVAPDERLGVFGEVENDFAEQALGDVDFAD